jgi:hypothetical protein
LDRRGPGGPGVGEGNQVEHEILPTGVGWMRRRGDGLARGGAVNDPDGVLACDARDRRTEVGPAGARPTNRVLAAS